MNKWIKLCLMGALSLPAQTTWAQEKAKTEKPAVPVKAQIVFTEYDGDKKVSSMPYAFTVLARERDSESTSVRTGVRIPIETDGKDQKTTYLDVGSNIDCKLRMQDDDRFMVTLFFDRSAIYPNKSPEGERLVVEPNGLPLIRQFRVSQNLLLKDGQTSETTLSTDPLNGHTLRVSVTINVQK